MREKRGARRPLVVGLTGGIGSGKSLALREFARLGAGTVSADEFAREAVRPGRNSYRRIVAAFGRGILGPRGLIARARLARLVFSDAGRRRRLESIVHPAVMREMRARLKRLAASGRGVLVADAPLLFEGGVKGEFDLTILVCAAPFRRLSRVMRRDGLSREQARARMAAQWSDGRKRVLADVVIPNEGSRREFLSRVGEYYRAFSLMTGANRHRQ